MVFHDWTLRSILIESGKFPCNGMSTGVYHKSDSNPDVQSKKFLL